ncbi:MAG: hypothetical protein GY926_19590 [bacterium]|nr:hypothetical protein [bacterium]
MLIGRRVIWYGKKYWVCGVFWESTGSWLLLLADDGGLTDVQSWECSVCDVPKLPDDRRESPI